MLQKFDGSHGGFDFVESVLKNEVIAAFEALLSIHLLLRHFIIELAHKIMRFSISGRTAKESERPKIWWKSEEIFSVR